VQNPLEVIDALFLRIKIAILFNEAGCKLQMKNSSKKREDEIGKREGKEEGKNWLRRFERERGRERENI
jgi:hypothetical protein